MSRKYYVIENGAQQGPYDIEQLRKMEITPDTFVWSSSMTDWKRAGDVAELTTLFLSADDQSAFGAYAQQQHPIQSQYPGGYNQIPAKPIPHTNWMPWAIVGTVLGAFGSCIGLIFGIIGIVKANKANRYYAMGDEIQGKNSNTTARVMSIISLSLGVISLVLSIIFVASGQYEKLMMQLMSMQNMQGM